MLVVVNTFVAFLRQRNGEVRGVYDKQARLSSIPLASHPLSTYSPPCRHCPNCRMFLSGRSVGILSSVRCGVILQPKEMTWRQVEGWNTHPGQ